MAFTVNQPPRLQIGNTQLNNTSDRVSLIWQTTGSDSGDSFKVEYRPANSNRSWQVASPSTSFDTSVGSRTNHEANITGLNYNSDYEYRVQQIRDGAVVDTYQSSFKTRLAPGNSTPFSFAAYGDSAYIQGNAGFREVQGQINQSDVDFAILLGDNAYDSGTHEEFDARFTNQYSPEALNWTSSHIDYAAVGNHEEYTDDGQPYLDSYILPEFNNAPETEKAYSFDYGSVHFATFNSNDAVNSESSLDRELQFIEQDLQASNADWKIVFAHHPVGGAPDKGESPEDDYYQKLIPLLNELGVDLLLTGHSHTYSHTYPLTGFNGQEATFVRDDDREYAKGAGVVQVISGMGGKSDRAGTYGNYPFVASGFSQSTDPASENGFSQISVTGDRLTVEYIAADNGEVLESFSIEDDPNSTSNPETIEDSEIMELTFEQGVNGYTGTVDTFLQEASPNKNNSEANSLNIDASDRDGEVHGLLSFEDLFGNQEGQIAPKTEIVSARLELDVHNPGDSIEFYRMVRDWSDNDTWNSLENGIQNNGIEAASNAELSTSSVSTGLLSVDVTDSVRDWQSDPDLNFGWAILPTGVNGVDFYSAESNNQPRLIVEYDSISANEIGSVAAQGIDNNLVEDFI